jgi:hypothetical protein
MGTMCIETVIQDICSERLDAGTMEAASSLKESACLSAQKRLASLLGNESACRAASSARFREAGHKWTKKILILQAFRDVAPGCRKRAR